MKLTPAQELTLWKMDRYRFEWWDIRGRDGWMSAYIWHSKTLAVLERHGLVERHNVSDPEGDPTYVVRLTDAGKQRVPTL